MKEKSFHKNHILRFRFNGFEVEKMDMLKKHNIKLSQFIREAFNEKFERDFPEISKPKNDLPF